ncbi:MAG: DMT family transporter [Pseudomonadota bacterium]
MSANQAAILWVLASTAIFSLVFASAKFADGAAGTFQILFLRFLAAFPLLLLYATITRQTLALRSPRLMSHFWRAVFGVGAVAAITWASARMPIADATALSMSYGILTVLLGVLFLGERVSAPQGVAVLLTVLGAAIVLRSQGAFSDSSLGWPVLVVLFGAILMALEALLIRVLSQAEAAVTLMVYVSGFGMLLMAGPAIWEWQAMGPWGYALCLALGPVSILGQYCTIRGYRLAPLSVVGPVDYSWLLFAIAIGVFVFGEWPGPAVLVGGGLIVWGGIRLSRTN